MATENKPGVLCTGGSQMQDQASSVFLRMEYITG